MNKSRILIIEDDEEMCEELIKFLEDEDYSSDVAYDGEEGMRFIKEDGYAIILLDLKMPGINGYEILKYIKEEYPATKVLVLTGSPIDREILNDYKNTTLKLADSVINKPFDAERVLSKIKELINTD